MARKTSQPNTSMQQLSLPLPSGPSRVPARESVSTPPRATQPCGSGGPGSSDSGSASEPLEELNLDNEEWSKDFIPYYLAERKASAEASAAVLRLLEVDPVVRARILARGTAEVERAGTDAKGTLGEAHLSFVLERKRHVLLTKAAWKEHPLEVTKGVDLVGVRLEDRLMQMAEVKTWPSVQYPSQLKQAFEEVVEDLALDRLDKRFLSGGDSAGHLQVAALLHRKIRERELPETVQKRLQDVKEELVRRDAYHRLGAVIADTPLSASSVTIRLEGGALRPWSLLMLRVEELDGKLTELAGIEAEWMEQSLKE